jgi:hypothetical protein
MAGRPTSKKSEEIIELIYDGLKPFEIKMMGYPWETVRYHYRKIKFPEKYKRFVKKITKYNSNRTKVYIK